MNRISYSRYAQKNPLRGSITLNMRIVHGNVSLLRLMEEILHQLIGSFSRYLGAFYIPGGAGFPPSTVVY